MMVGGELVAEGSASSADAGVTFSLQERFREIDPVEGNLTVVEVDSGQVVRLVGGRNPNEGRLQVKIKERWGTVCNYGWNIQSAAIACQQMGLVLNPQDWYLEADQLSSIGLEDPVSLSNVRCTDFDTDIRQCRSEPASQLENDCGHDQDVGLRCHDVSWAGLRFGMTAKKSVMRHVTVEKAGLFDYATYSFQPAVRIDFHHHVLDRLRLVNNDFDGMGVMYSDIYYPERIPSIKNSEFSSNRGHGISLRSLGVQLADCRVEDNVYSGVHYNPMITRQEMREMVGWLSILKVSSFAYKNNKKINFKKN
jgi:Scavenger receptor cysteine-rich domain